MANRPPPSRMGSAFLGKYASITSNPVGKKLDSRNFYESKLMEARFDSLLFYQNNEYTQHNVTPLFFDTDNDSDDAGRDEDDTVWNSGSATLHADGYDGKSMTIQLPLLNVILTLFLLC